jgi:hypothetical protein
MMAVRRATALKKTALVLAVSALTILIVLPALNCVNHSAANPPANGRKLVADGWPLPIPHVTDSELVADGWPLPIPHVTDSELVADGWPLPIPHATDSELVACQYHIKWMLKSRLSKRIQILDCAG